METSHGLLGGRVQNLVVRRFGRTTGLLLAKLLILSSDAISHLVATFYFKARTASLLASIIMVITTLRYALSPANVQVFELVFLVGALGIATGTGVAVSGRIISSFVVAHSLLKFFLLLQLLILGNGLLIIMNDVLI